MFVGGVVFYTKSDCDTQHGIDVCFEVKNIEKQFSILQQ